jgi:glutaconyl-CoA decarboxylase
MMKKYKITVDGKAYEVEVDDLVQGAAVSAAPVVAAPAVSAPAPATAPAKEKVDATAPAVQPVGDSKGEKLLAPMPGTILSVVVAPGQSVRKNEVLLILEAMKMENEIVAHRDAVIEGIFVQKGSVVNAGDALVSYT